MPFLLFFKLGAVRARDARLGGGGKKRRWMCGCVGVLDFQDVWVFMYH